RVRLTSPFLVAAAAGAADVAAVRVSAQERGPLAVRAVETSDLLYPIPDLSPLTQFNAGAAAAWSADYAAWQAWFAEWSNHNEPGWFGARDRRPKPEPPSWLAGACDELAIEEPWLLKACALLSDWRADSATAQF